jgi:hypothetical protein
MIETILFGNQTVMIAFAIGLVGCTILAVLQSISFRRQWSEWNALLNGDALRREFDGSGYAREHVEAALEDFRTRLSRPMLRRRALLEQYGLDGQALEEMLTPHLSEYGLSWDDLARTPLAGFALVTVDDYVRFLDAFARLRGE